MIFDDPALYKDHQVTRQLLYNQFNLPYGEASYIERVFAERDTPHLNGRALERIVTQLSAELTPYEQDPKRSDTQGLSIEVDKVGQRMLQVLFSRIKDRDEHVAPTIQTQVVQGYYTCAFTVAEAKRVLDEARVVLQGYE